MPATPASTAARLIELLRAVDQKLHPHWPKDTSGGLGGEFMPTNGGGHAEKPSFDHRTTAPEDALRAEAGREWLARVFGPYLDHGNGRLFNPKQPRDPHNGKWMGAGSDLSVLSDNDLLDRFAAISRTDAPDENALWAIDAEFARREATHRELQQALDSASDDQAKQVFGDLSEDTPVKRRIDELVAGGHDYRSAYAEAYNIDPAEMTRQELASALDVQKRPGETREKVVRRLYDEVTHLSYMRAEDWTRGNVLSRAGQAAGVSALSLFSGPRARARKHASEELKRFWAEVEPRQTYTEFRAAMLGRESDKKAAAILKQAGNAKDFGL